MSALVPSPLCSAPCSPCNHPFRLCVTFASHPRRRHPLYCKAYSRAAQAESAPRQGNQKAYPQRMSAIFCARICIENGKRGKNEGCRRPLGQNGNPTLSLHMRFSYTGSSRFSSLSTAIFSPSALRWMALLCASPRSRSLSGSSTRSAITRRRPRAPLMAFTP